jgi:hypothetical protein
MRFPRVMFVVAPAVLALAACGGGSGTPTTPAAVATSGAGSSVVTATGAPGTTAAAAPTSAPATGQPTSARLLDLCSLLTTADLFTVLDGHYLEGQLTSTGGYCHWDSGNSQLNEQVITAIDPRSLDAIKSAVTGETDMAVNGHAGISLRDATNRIETIYVDIGGQVLDLEFGTSSSATKDQEAAQALAEIAIGNL